ncbi:MAG: hypothetical protein HY901_19295 [Deltaproteobacteria bacterium]|nr:hypothetical protein [Deltaproteobacteria bacterium]
MNLRRISLGSAALTLVLCACSDEPAKGDLCAGVTCAPATSCRDSACDPSTGACVYHLKPAGTTCRASTGSCDPAEQCTGRNVECPEDSLAPASTVCRPAAGPCDAAETCSGTGGECPADALAPAGTLCRAEVGACDVPETCSGASSQCPDDSRLPAASVCRPAQGACDVAEACTGESGECPADVWVAAAAVCRSAAGECDVEETCSGASAQCPADALLPPTQVCRASAQPCDAEERCSGADAQCPMDLLEVAGTVCRAAVAPCDAAETCDGTSSGCPADALLPATTVCRPEAGACDVAERCTGTSDQCPPDSLLAAGTQCRASAGACDVAESCAGTSAACPADAFVAGGTECRASAGDCDPAESCSGYGAPCPEDARHPWYVTCRPATGACDLEEKCDGTATQCPADQHVAADTACGLASCLDGVATSMRRCDGLGTCGPATTTVCAPYQCGAEACETDCSVPADCLPGAFCVAQECRARESYIERWDGGSIAATGVSLAIAPDGTRHIGAVRGRELVVYSDAPGQPTWSAQKVAGFATDPQVRVDPSGGLHAVWQEQGEHLVRYGRKQPGGEWAISTVDEGFRPALGVDSHGQPHLAYHVWVGFGSVNKYAIPNPAGGWFIEPITAGGGMGCYCSSDPSAHCSCGSEPGRPLVAIGADDVAHVLFPRFATYTGLELATRVAGGWAFDEVEWQSVLDGATSLAIAADGSTHMVYAVLGDRLRSATDATGAWTRQDTTLPALGSTSLAHDGSRHLCGFGPALYYATDRSGAWVITTIDAGVRNARYCSLALDASGAVHIAYQEGDTGSLKIAENTSGDFQSSYVERAGLYGGRVGFAMDGAGKDHLAAPRRAFTSQWSWKDYDAAYWTNRGSGTPVGVQVSQGSNVVPRVVLGVDAQGAAHLAFHQDALVYASNRQGTWGQTSLVLGWDQGREFALALTSGGLPRIGLCAAHEVKYASTADGSSWQNEIVEATEGTNLALVIDPLGAPQLLYSNASGLRHAHPGPTAWTAETVQPSGTYMPNSVAVSSTGALHVVFYGQGLVYAHNDTGSWLAEPIAPVNGVNVGIVARGYNEFPIVLDAQGRPRVFLVNGAEELVGLVRDGGAWYGEVYDRAAGRIEGIGAAAAPDRTLHIGYIAENALYRAVVPDR